MAVSIDKIKARLPQVGVAKLTDAYLTELIAQAEDFVEATDITYDSDQEDALVLDYASYLAALGLQGTSTQVDPNFYLDSYKLMLKQIATYKMKQTKTDGVDKQGVVTIGKLGNMPDFNGKVRKRGY